MCQRASELGNFSHLYKVPKLQYLSMFELVLTNNMTRFSVTYFVTSVHSLQFPFYILLMTWHYKRITSYRQNTHIEIIYSVRARKIYENFEFLDEIVKF